MSKFNEITTMAYIKGEAALEKAVTSVKNAVSDFDKDERGVEGFVVALILIGIAAIFALAFRKQLKIWFDQVVAKINDILKDE